ncbi:hypothetical protein BDP27DRAFT_1363426 [Rhodocollybia butyracea]|uniref:Uncharacterized protein n=1 Tax=Rhodocollybia butyracea TaxID=206335 RepID=A0A9P5PVJ4_9AGAR|nr:hypothetical protein BDP27DRAFT_1363426 [Rhodocollybia butyracea]
MPNYSGSNGHYNGTRPSDERLQTVLHDYALRGLLLRERLLYLEQQEGYKISYSTLKQLNRQFEVPTVRKPPPLLTAATYVSKAVSANTAARNGPNTIRQTIVQQDGVLIPRDTVRAIMKDNYSEGAEIWFPGKKLGQGVFQEVHFDGHEKLCAKALRMGSGHGSIGFDIRVKLYERRLSWDSPRDTLIRASPFIFQAHSFSSDLFHWIWPKIIQQAVDSFIHYWNDHKTRKQVNSNLPSGVAPNVIFDFPANYGLKLR